MSERVIKEDYIFFYSIDYNQDSVDIARWYSKEFGIPVVTMFTSWKSYFICKNGVQWSGKTDVEDFLSLVYYSKFVLSGSFHGVAFSVIFNKPFFRVQKKRGEEQLIDDRIRTMFDKLGIVDREIWIDNYKDKLKEIFDIDYSLINERICEEREKGLSFLKENISNL